MKQSLNILLVSLLVTVCACSVTEVCGNLVDDDGSGGDLPCPEPDKDFDGYQSKAGTGTDCDDNNRFLYPGVYRRCGSSGYQQCKEDGTWSSCVETAERPLCEAAPGSTCYYINQLTGSDDFDGSFRRPWKTYLNITSYPAGTPPPNHRKLKPGDVVYFFSGTYEDTYRTEVEGTIGLKTVWFFLRNTDGTRARRIKIKAYPGERVILRQVGLEGCDYITVEGMEIAGNPTDTGVFVKASWDQAGSDYVELANLKIYDNDGVEDNNAAGIDISQGSSYADVHHNIVANNYDRDEIGQNNSNIVLFRGTGNRIHHNLVYNDRRRLGSCIKYKHGTKGGRVEVDHNIVWNCAGVEGNDCAIGSGMPGHFHHNIVAHSFGPAFRFRNYGGPTFTENIIVENNTIIDMWGLEVDHTFSDSRGEVIFRNNTLK